MGSRASTCVLLRFTPQAASVPAADVSMNSRRRMKGYHPLIKRRGAVVVFCTLSLSLLVYVMATQEFTKKRVASDGANRESRRAGFSVLRF